MKERVIVMCKGKSVLVSLVFCVMICPTAAFGQTESCRAEPTTASRPVEAQVDQSVSDLITRNVEILCKKHWGDALGAIAWVSVSVILWSICLCVLGLILGILAFFRLRKRGMFDVAPGTPGRFVWVWGIVFTLSFSLGGAYGGGWLGLERGIKKQILTKQAVDGLIVSIIQANVLHAANFELTGDETAEELQEVVAQSEAVANLVMDDFIALIDKVIDEQTKDKVPRWIVDIARNKIREKFLEKMQDELHGVDPRLLAIAIFEADSKKYLEKYPKAKPVAALFAGFLDNIRQEACNRVSGFTRPGMWTGFLGGLLVPFLALFVFRKAVRPKSIPQSNG
jgi:hypothetical protein